MRLSANLSQPLNLGTLLSVILAATGTILAVSNSNHFVGAVLAGLAAVSIPLQAWLSTFVIDIPAPDYDVVLGIFTGLAYVVGASSLIVQWFVNFDPAGKPFIVTALGVAALACAMFTQLFHASASKTSAKRLAHSGASGGPAGVVPWLRGTSPPAA
jgi:hypothetical protein